MMTTKMTMRRATVRREESGRRGDPTRRKILQARRNATLCDEISIWPTFARNEKRMGGTLRIHIVEGKQASQSIRSVGCCSWEAKAFLDSVMRDAKGERDDGLE